MWEAIGWEIKGREGAPGQLDYSWNPPELSTSKHVNCQPPEMSTIVRIVIIFHGGIVGIGLGVILHTILQDQDITPS